MTDDTRYRAECECGQSSEVVPHEIVAQGWAADHADAHEELVGERPVVEVREVEP